MPYAAGMLRMAGEGDLLDKDYNSKWSDSQMLDVRSLVSQQMPSIEAPENLPGLLIVITVCTVCFGKMGCRHACQGL